MRIVQGIRPCGAFTYIPNFDQISVKISVLGVLYPYCCTDGGDIWHGGGDHRSPPPCQMSPHRCNVLPLRGEKPQKWPLSNLNNPRFVLHSMLPVNEQYVTKQQSHYIGSQPSDHYFRSVCLSVCLFVCAEFFSAVFDPIWIKLGHMLHVRV